MREPAPPTGLGIPARVSAGAPTNLETKRQAVQLTAMLTTLIQRVVSIFRGKEEAEGFFNRGVLLPQVERQYVNSVGSFLLSLRAGACATANQTARHIDMTTSGG
ncbi:hypothetical protein EGR_01654 [Echinococcus granulosus]|uniref:Uncharacterized protein n=2 Tax=Echinococcus granulosus TaxID=6210 RepID=W6UY89_ECHGR|nr:hypothetical protein EGR_01654 [Echinococcus granulosus]EUB63572.1 hypothetical protein EGR_01654 [Echinococcus granulosus]